MSSSSFFLSSLQVPVVYFILKKFAHYFIQTLSLLILPADMPQLVSSTGHGAMCTLDVTSIAKSAHGELETAAVN